MAMAFHGLRKEMQEVSSKAKNGSCITESHVRSMQGMGLPDYLYIQFVLQGHFASSKFISMGKLCNA